MMQGWDIFFYLYLTVETLFIPLLSITVGRLHRTRFARNRGAGGTLPPFAARTVTSRTFQRLHTPQQVPKTTAGALWISMMTQQLDVGKRSECRVVGLLPTKMMNPSKWAQMRLIIDKAV